MLTIDIAKKSCRIFFRKLTLFFLLILLFTPTTNAKKHIRSLKHEKVKSIEIICDTATTRNAGTNFSFGVAVTLNNEQVIKTKGYLDGKVRWNNFEISAVGANVSNGKVHIPGKTDLVSPDFIILVVSSKHHDSILTRKRIEKNFLASLKLFPTNNFAKAPGNVIYPGIEKTYDNAQKEFVTKKRLVKKEIAQYDVFVNGGNFFNDCFRISPDIFSIINHRVGFMFSHKENPELAVEYEVLLDYIDNYRHSERGFSGRSGTSGFSGSSGGNGHAGGNGGNGGHGRDGEPGSDGGNGPNLNVYADAYFDTILQTDLVRVLVNNADDLKSSYYLVNPKGGSISVLTRGGDGGSGGCGGNGGRGGNGGDGIRRERTIVKKVPCEKEVESSTEKDSNGNPKKEKIRTTCEETKTIVEIGSGGNGGWGGHGGKGGNGGYGGDGGDIVAFFSPTIINYEYIIHLISERGDGGNGGHGGNGGSGGRGGSGSPSGYSGNAGLTGSHGYDGIDGWKGEIIVYDWDGHLDF